MSLEAKLQADLKTAQLARDEQTVSVLRMLKSTLLYAKVAAGSRDEEMPDKQVEEILAKEAKKRQESADLFKQGGNDAKAADELQEKAIIERYLPTQLTEDQILELIDAAIAALGATTPAQMGQVIGAVKAKAGTTADGGIIARLAKERLAS
jgi:uncharacterized protein YqeY